MNWLSSDDSRDGAGRCVNQHSLAKQDLQIPSADRIDSDESIAVDVFNDQADLITVSIQQDRDCPLRIDCR